MTTVLIRVLGILLSLMVLPAYAAQIIVVDDKGGASALPYYRSLNPQPQAATAPLIAPDPRAAEGLPIRSKNLTPGQIQGRVINAPGLQPLFIVGDDEASRLWLLKHSDQLRNIQAVGLIVNVASHERLAVIRSWVEGVVMSPASGDDLVQRLGLNHYPALITATAIEQ
ncbi:integrating conjugative element protein [Pseudomonas serbiensis]